MKSIYIKAYVLAEMSEMLPVCLHFKCATVFLQHVIESDLFTFMNIIQTVELGLFCHFRPLSYVAPTSICYQLI